MTTTLAFRVERTTRNSALKIARLRSRVSETQGRRKSRLRLHGRLSQESNLDSCSTACRRARMPIVPQSQALTQHSAQDSSGLPACDVNPHHGILGSKLLAVHWLLGDRTDAFEMHANVPQRGRLKHGGSETRGYDFLFHGFFVFRRKNSQTGDFL